MFETFSFVEGNVTGRCMDTKQMVNFLGLKERMNIRVNIHDGTSLNQCLYVAYWNDDPLDIHDGCFNDEKEYYWIYTKDKQLITLNRFDCLTLGSDNKVTVSRCKASSKNQQWYCDANGTLYFQDGGGSQKYINGGFRLSATGLQEWKSYDPTQGSDRGNVCDKPVEYKGCYRLDVESNGRFIKNIDSSSGATTIKVLAPIFLENTKCSINWQDSTYLKNSRPWKTVGKPDGGITVSNADGKSKGIDLKIS